MALTWEQTLEEEKKKKPLAFLSNPKAAYTEKLDVIPEDKKLAFMVTQPVPAQSQPNVLPRTESVVYDKRISKPGPAPTGNWISNNSTGDVFTLNADNSISGTQPLKEIGRMGGFKPDGTSIVPSGNQGDVDALKNPSPQSLRNLQQMQFAEREFIKNYRPPVNNNGIKPGMNESERIAIRNENTARANALLNANTIASNAREENRINEMNVLSQNKLRDIQGQVAQAPPVKELDDSYDTRDVYDDLGQKIGQKIYNKRTGQDVKSAISAESIINSNPSYKKAFDIASPEKKAEMLKKLNERISMQ